MSVAHATETRHSLHLFFPVLPLHQLSLHSTFFYNVSLSERTRFFFSFPSFSAPRARSYVFVLSFRANLPLTYDFYPLFRLKIYSHEFFFSRKIFVHMMRCVYTKSVYKRRNIEDESSRTSSSLEFYWIWRINYIYSKLLGIQFYGQNIRKKCCVEMV